MRSKPPQTRAKGESALPACQSAVFHKQTGTTVSPFHPSPSGKVPTWSPAPHLSMTVEGGWGAGSAERERESEWHQRTLDKNNKQRNNRSHYPPAKASFYQHLRAVTDWNDEVRAVTADTLSGSHHNVGSFHASGNIYEPYTLQQKASHKEMSIEEKT